MRSNIDRLEDDDAIQIEIPFYSISPPLTELDLQVRRRLSHDRYPSSTERGIFSPFADTGDDGGDWDNDEGEDFGD